MNFDSKIFLDVYVFTCSVMAGRKRRISNLKASAAPVPNVNKRETKTDLNVSDPEVKRSFRHEKGKCAETALSRYFTENNIQRRLGDDFFQQPCITLAKAMLGKVR